MALLNFQKQFAEAVKSGTKRQTIRKERKYPIKKGERLYLYAGLRTKKAKKLKEAKCRSVKKIKIFQTGPFYNIRIMPEHSPYYLCTINDDQFAKDDGFENSQEMINWFEKTHGLPFEGILIRW